MKLPRRKFLHLAAGAAALPALPHIAWAQAYPTRPVRIIVGGPPAGGADIVARLMGQWLSERLGQPFVIENRPGAGTNIGTEAVAKAPPDGYTILLATPANAINATLYDNLNFNFIRDIAPVAGIVRVPNVMVVNPSVPARTVHEFIAYAKANPGKVNYASSGHGAAAHLAAELFKAEAKIDIVHVPYKGAAPALQDVIAGHVQMMFATAASVVPHIQSGQVRALAVTTLKRTAVFPELATVDELGLKGFDATTWHGLVAPSRTPKDVVATLHRATVAALADAAVRKSLGDLGVDIVGNTPEQFTAYIKAEIPKWTAIVKASGATLD